VKFIHLSSYRPTTPTAAGIAVTSRDERIVVVVVVVVTTTTTARATTTTTTMKFCPLGA